MDKDIVSMSARIEVTKQLRRDYRTGSKAEKSAILDQFCASTGLGRSTARRYLTSQTIGVKNVVRIDRRKHKPTKYSANAKKQLIRVWRLMGMPSGKYMKPVMEDWLDALEAHDELAFGRSGYNPTVRAQLVAMSAATIDRYLKAERDRLRLKGIATTKPGALLRNSITVRQAGDEVEDEPGFFETDTVAHCGPTLQGEFARTLTMTDVRTGWVHLEVLRHNAQVHILAGLDRAAAAIPYGIAGLDCDNGSEFINHEVMHWAADRLIFFTRGRPYQKNDQATVESKNNHAVRKFGFHYRYDTADQRAILAALWQVVGLKLNYFTATKKPTGWTQDASGRRKRLYDKPKTPYHRLLDAGILSTAQQEELAAIYRRINPAQLTRQILTYQDRLISLAKDKTLTIAADLDSKHQARQKRRTTGIRTKAS
ncbi:MULTISPECIES: integrase catalytic domain-containing protein [Auritidibacter]|uniref:Transposase family protein n=3 Tax=Auritidibacter TaxID=1160973 RepID=A0AAJ6AIR1_9MICC|nr:MULTISPECIES: DDE-type integrase/transposase/recombinase [Auritidibacter]WGH82453.1 transposase family protein [Auritidibacter ignavus]WGH83044.1 transposase family protein [Auritidibacter ignavus]WGH83469.1 transposase family protein [Auritidibacter ignavus]WGH85880.1 transposase family protein [Auritidibacter ignavus]WGH88167.1 transposase family protein [Auritidibacter ignavus]